jgi:hypothetical protein
MKKRNNHIIFLTNFSSLNATYTTNKFLINYIQKKFKKIYIINAENLICSQKKKYFFSSEILKRSKNIIIKNFTKNNFVKFTRKTKNIIILNLNQDPKNLKIYKILQPANYKVIMISNIGNFQGIPINEGNKNLFKVLVFIYKKKIFPKVLTILSNLGIATKIDLRFMCNKNYFNNITNHKIKNFLYQNGLLLTKKIILINSKISDLSKIEKIKLSNKHIVHLDQDLQYKHVKEITCYDNNQIKKHYYYLNIFLEHLSRIFKKKVIVSIHPSYNQKLISKNLPKFKVIKYKTRELIKKSYLVTFIGSSSIVDAILLKKKILALKSEIFVHKNAYVSKLNIPSLNFFDNQNISKIKLLKLIKSKNGKINNYIKNYHHAGNKKSLGVEKVCQEIQRI